MEEERNHKLKQTKNNTPAIVLAILFGIVILLLYAGWNLMSDDTTQITAMKSADKASAENIDTDLIEEATLPIAEETEKVEEVVEAPVVLAPEPEKVEEKVSVSNYSGETGTHTVKNGETFFSIANKFNVSQETLKSLNPSIDPNTIKVGITKIKVPVQVVHTVGPGDILRVVATKYGISVEALMAANGKTKNRSERGEKLLIPIKKKI